MLVNASGYGENVRVKNNVFWRKVHLIHQHAVGALANFNLARVGIGLAFFIKRHHHGSRAIAAQQFGLMLKRINAFFHADGVHHRLALHAAQARLNHAPFAGVDHDGHPGNVRLRGYEVQKPHHGGLAVEHGLVHIDVDDLRAVFYLLARHGQRLLELAVQYHAGKRFGASDVGALANIDKSGARSPTFGTAQRSMACTNRHRL